MVEFFIFIREQQKVELIFNNDKRIYGTIITVLGNNITIVTEQKINLKKNEKIEINTYSDNGVYSGESHVIDFKWEYKKRTIIIEYPREIKHTQRREYLRANIKTDFELIITKDNDENNNKKEIIKGKTRDLCGKGISFIYQKSLSQFSKYNVKIKLKTREILSSCQLVYTKITFEEGQPKFINAFVLSGITFDDSKFITEECMRYHLKQE